MGMRVEDALDALPLGPIPFLVLLAAIFTQVCNAAFCEIFIYVRPELVEEFKLTDEMHGVLQSVGFYSQLAGFLLSSACLDRLGRKLVLTTAAGLISVCFLGLYCATTYTHIVALRAMSGFSPGIFQTAAPVYLSEFFGPKKRAYYVCLFNFGYPLGACIILLIVDQLHGAWRQSCGAIIYPCVATLALLVCLPEAPLYLEARGRTADAQEVVERMHRALSVEAPPIRYSPPRVEQCDPVEKTTKHRSTFAWLASYFALLGFASVGCRNWLPEFLVPRSEYSTGRGVFPYKSVLFFSFADLIGDVWGALWIDRVGRLPLVMLGFGLSGASTLGVMLCGSYWMQAFCGGMQQLTQAWVWVSIGTLVCELFPTDCRGFYSGLLYALSCTMMIASPIFGGYMFDRGLGDLCIMVYGVVYLVGGFLAGTQHFRQTQAVQQLLLTWGDSKAKYGSLTIA